MLVSALVMEGIGGQSVGIGETGYIGGGGGDGGKYATLQQQGTNGDNSAGTEAA